MPSEIVVDVMGMDWLVGQDWGFLLKLAERLSPHGVRLSMRANRRVVRGGRALGLDRWLGLIEGGA